MHPGAWLLWALCGGLAALATTNPYYLLLIVAATTLVHTAHRVPGPTEKAFKIFVVF